MLCQQTSRKRWFANMIITSDCDVTNSIRPVTMPNMRHCSMLQCGREAYNQGVAPGITTPLHATGTSTDSQQLALITILSLTSLVVKYFFAMTHKLWPTGPNMDQHQWQSTY